MATTADSIFTPRHLDYLPVSLFGSVMGLTELHVDHPTLWNNRVVAP